LQVEEIVVESARRGMGALDLLKASAQGEEGEEGA